MKLVLNCTALALVVLFSAATCTRGDEAALNCKPPEKEHHCMMECMARRCNEPFLTYAPARIDVPLCGTDVNDVMWKFWQITSRLDIKDCGDPSCVAASDTGSGPILPSGTPSAGTGYHEQGETESGATGGFWEPVPGGETCMP